MDLFEDEDAMGRANTAVVDFLRNHPVAKSWGNGTLASADSMSLEASRHVWNARVDPRHRRYAIGMYTHVLDQWGIIYDQPMILNKRQAGAAIEGMVRQSGAPEVSALAVDTHGHTDFAMAISKLLGFDLCPRLRNLSHRKLHVPKGFDVPEVLAGVVVQDVSIDALKSGWDSLVRVAASVETGKISAVLALDRYGSASRGDPIHQAGTALGRMYRTLFLCDYFTNDRFRRELLRVLNYGESTHALQRTIHFGGIPPNHGRYRDELVAISGSLTLLTNLTMAWVTHRMQKVIDQRGRVGRMLDESTLRHIGPVHCELINFRGRYDFPIEKFAGRIMPQNGSGARSERN
jgi:TnpA family transposase